MELSATGLDIYTLLVVLVEAIDQSKVVIDLNASIQAKHYANMVLVGCFTIFVERYTASVFQKRRNFDVIVDLGREPQLQKIKFLGSVGHLKLEEADSSCFLIFKYNARILYTCPLHLNNPVARLQFKLLHLIIIKIDG